jgi:exopolyphosphatase/guanosine-5'-triphosphate,3'-diphosphate pyrophosphatase
MRHNGRVSNGRVSNVGANRVRSNKETPEMSELPDTPDRPDRIVTLRSGEIRAAMDLGTNSFHLLVARITADGHFDVLAKEKEVVRLGSASGDLDTLTDDAMDRGIEALGRFRQIADSFDAAIDAVATSAIREATNREAFLTRALTETGIAIEVVSGVEEARLIHLGVLQSVPLFDARTLVVDIGGGSTELLVGCGPVVEVARSTKVGAIRLTNRFFPGGRVKAKMVSACRDYVGSFLVPTLNEIRGFRPFTVVGSSGTILNMARIICGLRGDDPLSVRSGSSFTAGELHEAVELLISRKTPDERADIVGLDERRTDIIVAGALLLEEIFGRLAIDHMVVSDAALREGILVDRGTESEPPDSFHHLSDIRRQSVLRMAEIYHEDIGHIGRATDLALLLFDGLVPAHELETADRDLLEAAGLLHNVGLFVSHAAHHKHSYYVIRNSDQLAGFTDHEVELIAQIARYHRKSAPKSSHGEFQTLCAEDQRRIRLLAGMLRVGIALDRTRQGGVDGISVRLPEAAGDSGPIAVEIRCLDDVDLSLEMYTSCERVDLLVTALGQPVELQFVSARPVS